MFMKKFFFLVSLFLFIACSNDVKEEPRFDPFKSEEDGWVSCTEFIARNSRNGKDYEVREDFLSAYNVKYKILMYENEDQFYVKYFTEDGIDTVIANFHKTSYSYQCERYHREKEK